MESRLDDLDLLAIQIDGIHMDEDMILVAAIGVDANGDKHPLGLVEGATENATTVQALIDNLVERGLDPSAPRLFIIDGSKALSKAIRRTFGRDAAIQRCQVHKARNILERLPKSMHASVKRVLRQAWEMRAGEKPATVSVASKNLSVIRAVAMKGRALVVHRWATTRRRPGLTRTDICRHMLLRYFLAGLICFQTMYTSYKSEITFTYYF